LAEIQIFCSSQKRSFQCSLGHASPAYKARIVYTKATESSVDSTLLGGTVNQVTDILVTTALEVIDYTLAKLLHNGMLRKALDLFEVRLQLA
jgi:hypothetical protein